MEKVGGGRGYAAYGVGITVGKIENAFFHTYILPWIGKVRYNTLMKTQRTKALVYQALKTVMDPELNIDIVSLGLIYEVEVREGEVTIIMTLTTPGCPLAPVIDRMIKEAMQPLGFEKVYVDLIWDPPWVKDMMSEEARLQLGII